jgi:hypothetical protein
MLERCLPEDKEDSASNGVKKISFSAVWMPLL